MKSRKRLLLLKIAIIAMWFILYMFIENRIWTTNSETISTIYRTSFGGFTRFDISVFLWIYCHVLCIFLNVYDVKNQVYRLYIYVFLKSGAVEKLFYKIISIVVKNAILYYSIAFGIIYGYKIIIFNKLNFDNAWIERIYAEGDAWFTNIAFAVLSSILILWFSYYINNLSVVFGIYLFITVLMNGIYFIIGFPKWMTNIMLLQVNYKITIVESPCLKIIGCILQLAVVYFLFHYEFLKKREKGIEWGA